MFTQGKKKRILIWAVVSFFARGALGGDSITLPPAPNFGQPVDYVGWIRQRLQVADEDNACSQYAKFFRKTSGAVPSSLGPTCPLVKQYVRDLLVNPQPWVVSDVEYLQAYLERISPYLEAYEKGTQHKCFAVPIEFLGETLFETVLPHIDNSLVLTKAEVAAAWRAEKGFDTETFCEKMETVLRHSDHILQGFTLLECVVAVRERNMVYTSILAALNQKLIGARLVDRLKRYLSKADLVDMRDHLTRGIQFEKIFWWDLLQQLSELSPIIGRARFNRPKTERMIKVFTPVGEDRSRTFIRKVLGEDPKELARLIECYHSKSIDIIRGKFVDTYETALDGLREQYQKGHVYFEAFPMTSFSRPYLECLQTERKRRMIHLALEVLTYEISNGSFPETLSTLKSGDAQPMHNDPVTGREFDYAASPRKITLVAPNKEPFKGITVELGTLGE